MYTMYAIQKLYNVYRYIKHISIKCDKKYMNKIIPTEKKV